MEAAARRLWWGETMVKEGKNGSQRRKGTWFCPASGCEGKNLGCSEERTFMWAKLGRAAGRRWQGRECWPKLLPI